MVLREPADFLEFRQHFGAELSQVLRDHGEREVAVTGSLFHGDDLGKLSDSGGDVRPEVHFAVDVHHGQAHVLRITHEVGGGPCCAGSPKALPAGCQRGGVDTQRFSGVGPADPR
ncbi:hypothetical protein D3C73_1233210 [compost metagenome]